MPDAAKDGTNPQEGAKIVAPMTMSVSDVAARVNASGENADVRTIINNDTVLANRILQMNDSELAELEEQLKKTPLPSEPPKPPEPDKAGAGAPPPPAAPSSTPAPGATTPNEELLIKLKPSDLSTYLTKDRSPQEAVVELVKGKKSADDRIRFYKEDQIPALERMSQNLVEKVRTLQKELETLKAKGGAPAAAPASAAPAPAEAKKAALKEIKVPDEIDFYDPEAQKTVHGLFSDFQENIAALKSEIESMKKGGAPAAAPASAAPAPAEAAVVVPQEPSPEAIAEFDEIRLFQKNPDTENLFTTKTDIAEVERQYLSFVVGLGKITGQANVFSKDGSFSPEINRILDVYFDPKSPDNQRLKAAAAAAFVAPPEELPVLQRLYALRDVRNSYHARNPITGEIGPVQYTEALRLARSLRPEIFSSIQNQGPQSDRAAIAAAADSRKRFAPDPSSSSSANADELQRDTEEEYLRLMSKDRDQYTPEEIESLGRMLKKMANFTDQEVANYFKRPGG